MHVPFFTGNNYIHITDWSDVTTPTILDRITIDFTCNDIETCGDFVGFVLEGPTKVDTGTLQIYSLYDKAAGNWSKLHEIPSEKRIIHIIMNIRFPEIIILFLNL